MRAQHAPPRRSRRLPPRARASTHLGEASAPKARGWGHHYTKTFAYDPVGNRTTQTTTGTGADTDSYAYDTRDRLTSESDNTTSYGYDLNGNVTSKTGEASYAWDFENRLSTANMTASGAAVAHEYDPDGNRVQTSVTSSGSTATTNLLVDTVGSLSQVVTETDGSANLTALYVRVGDDLVEVMRPGSTAGTWSTRFIHHDGLGSVRALTDETGTTTDTRGYEAFGTKNVEAGSDPLTYGFAGEPLQADSMLAYHRARWMDARVGRFEGMDPFKGYIHSPLSLHRYLYCSANPANRIDPSGKQGDIEDVSISVEVSAIEATTPEAVAAHPAEIAAEVAAENAEAITETAIEETAIEAEAQATETTVQETIAQGATAGAGKLGGVLLAIEQEFALNSPSTAFQALSVVQRAVASVGLDIGYAAVAANGAIVLTNKGGVITTVTAIGSIIVEKAGQVLLSLPGAG